MCGIGDPCGCRWSELRKAVYRGRTRGNLRARHIHSRIFRRPSAMLQVT